MKKSIASFPDRCTFYDDRLTIKGVSKCIHPKTSGKEDGWKRSKKENEEERRVEEREKGIKGKAVKK